FPRESAKPELSSPPNARRAAAAAGPPPVRPPVEMDVRLDGARLQRFEVAQRNLADVSSVTVGGPYNPTGAGDNPSRARIFVCHPSGPGQERACAEKILATVGRRAFRRPVT